MVLWLDSDVWGMILAWITVDYSRKAPRGHIYHQSISWRIAIFWRLCRCSDQSDQFPVHWPSPGSPCSFERGPSKGAQFHSLFSNDPGRVESAIQYLHPHLRCRVWSSSNRWPTTSSSWNLRPRWTTAVSRLFQISRGRPTSNLWSSNPWRT